MRNKGLHDPPVYGVKQVWVFYQKKNSCLVLSFASSVFRIVIDNEKWAVQN